MIDLKNISLYDFAEFMKETSREVGFRVSSRGWAYILEQKRFINKDQFDTVTNKINSCRKRGFLPIDFTAEESAREFSGVETVDEISIIDDFGNWIDAALVAANNYVPDWWNGEEYYIQMVVEKIDLVTLFEPVCRQYHIPIANSKGWSSMLQRAEYARRFAEAEANGLKCVLLYCGDHDPDGLRISEFIRKNLNDLRNVEWTDGTSGYNPSDLIIDRFGLNYDFILDNKLTWIDNLITGSGRDLASPSHKNYNMPYVQEYLNAVGSAKCEANALVVIPDVARTLVKESIESYLGPDALNRFAEKKQAVKDELSDWLEESGSGDLIQQVLDNIEEHGK